MERSLIKIPEDFLCPITQQMMENPVVVADGHSYEREFIDQWFKRGNRTSPLTNQPLDNFTLTPNLALKKAIIDFRQKMPEIQRENALKLNMKAKIEALEKERDFLAMENKKMEQIRRTEARIDVDPIIQTTNVNRIDLEGVLSTIRKLLEQWKKENMKPQIIFTVLIILLLVWSLINSVVLIIHTNTSYIEVTYNNSNT